MECNLNISFLNVIKLITLNVIELLVFECNLKIVLF